jgi:hypothetical protein
MRCAGGHNQLAQLDGSVPTVSDFELSRSGAARRLTMTAVPF